MLSPLPTRLIFTLLFCAALCLTAACSGTPDPNPDNTPDPTPKPDPQAGAPEWVAGGVGALNPVEYPRDAYRYGVGVAGASEALDPFDAARQRAMREISEGVAVSIAAEFQRSVEEIGQGEQTQLSVAVSDSIKSVTSLELKGFDVLETWQNADGSRVWSLGRISQQSLDEAAIAAKLEEAWRRDPGLLYVMALQEWRAGELDAARASLRESLALRPDDARVQLSMGKLLLERAQADSNASNQQKLDAESEAITHLKMAAAIASEGAIGAEARERIWTLADKRMNQEPVRSKDLRPFLDLWWLEDSQRSLLINVYLKGELERVSASIIETLREEGLDPSKALYLMPQNADGRETWADSFGFGQQLASALQSTDDAPADPQERSLMVQVNADQGLVVRVLTGEKFDQVVCIHHIFLPAMQTPEAPTLRGTPITLESALIAQDPLSKRWFAVREGEVLNSGQRFRINFRTSEKAWVYAVNFNAQGDAYVFAPAGFESTPLPAQSLNKLPAASGASYQLDHHVGTEECVIVASTQPIPAIEEALKQRNQRSELDSAARAKLSQAIRDAVIASERGVLGVSMDLRHWLSAGSEQGFLCDRVSGFRTVVRRISYQHK